MAATSAVIFFASASISFLKVPHGPLLDARLLDRFDDQLTRGRPEPGFQAHLLEAALDQVVAQIRGAVLRELAKPAVEPLRDRRRFQGLIEQPPEELHRFVVRVDALPRRLRDLLGEDRVEIRRLRVRRAPTVHVVARRQMSDVRQPPRRRRAGELQREEHLDAPVEFAAGRRRVRRDGLELAAALGDDLDPRRDAAEPRVERRRERPADRLRPHQPQLFVVLLRADEVGMAHQADRAERPGHLPRNRDDPVGEGVDRGLVGRGNEREAELELVEDGVPLRTCGAFRLPEAVEAHVPASAT